MAKYPSMITTKKGLDLNSEANATQKAVVFTRVVVGDGSVPNNTAIQDMTNVISPKMDLAVSGGANQGNGQYTVRASLANDTLASGFYAKEVGLYAKLAGSTNEVLYAYTNGGNYVDYIPDKSTPIDAQEFNIDVVIGNAATVNIEVKNETYITVQDLQSHEDNEDAHQNLSSTIDQTLEPTADKNTLRNLLSNLANMIMQTTGQDDWKKAPVKNIAQILTMFSALVDNLEVEWTENNTKFSVPSLGISGLMAQNGYLSFGPLFGGLIIQWGLASESNGTTDYRYYPISFPTMALSATSTMNKETSDAAWVILVDRAKYLVGALADIEGTSDLYVIFIGY